MKTKELELFKETDFFQNDKRHTYIKRNCEWYLFDNIKNRNNFSIKKNNKYMMVYNSKSKQSYEGTIKCSVIPSDAKAVNINMFEYIKLAESLKTNGDFIFNKKLGKAILKKN